MTKKEDHWRGVIKSFEESGLAPGEFCKKQGISGSRFRFYLKKFREESQADTPAQKPYSSLLLLPHHPLPE